MEDSKKNIKKILSDIIEIARKENASDVHLSEGRNPMLRINGVLVPITSFPEINKKDMEEFIFQLLSPDSRSEFMSKKEIDFSKEISGVRLRGNCFFQQGFVSVVLRLVQEKIKNLEELKLPEILEVFARKKQGFFLVVGPTGHGKSTTLASILNIINENRNAHILTIEDPIEFVHKQKKSIIDQREIKIDTKDFPTALRSMFRQDIDVVMLGEMRGLETIKTAVTAAETGHLVLSTLHTNSASQTIDRIIDSFPAEQQKQIRNQLSGSLIGIFSQRLIKSVSGGRIPAYELLINNSAVSNLIREGRIAEIDSFIETSYEQGMISFNRSLAELVRKGEITVEDAYVYSPKTKSLERML